MMIGFGISSLFFAILGVVVPSWGIFISGLSGFLAWMTAGKGIPLGIAAVVINLVNIFLFSPSYMLVVGLESHLRTPEQNKILYIWMVVLFLQISAIGVHVVNFGLSKIDIEAIKRAFKRKKRNNPLPRGNGPIVENISKPPLSNIVELASADDVGTPVPLSLETPIAQIYNGGTREESEIFKPEPDNSKNLEDISFDGSRPHSELRKPNRTLLKVYAIVVSCVCLAFLLVFFRPESSFYLNKAISKTFSEKYLDKTRRAQAQPNQTEETQRKSALTRPLSNKSNSIPVQNASRPAPIRSKNVDSGGYWYVIELKSGETILTQDAVITRNFVAIHSLAGKERKINKTDLASFKRIKI